MNTPTTSLEDWIRRLRDREMPIFSRTVQALNEAMESKRSGVLELSRIILEDPTLTAKVLKLSNSPYYNPGRQKLATITRAIVLIGLQTVRDLALACSFIETVLAHPNKKQVQREIARSLHSAVQAKSIAILANDPQPEEVFIAALLNNLGEVVFWCFGEQQGQEVTRRMDEGMTAVQAEREVLGFKLSQLGASLSRHWKLGDLVEDAYKNPSLSSRADYAKLGCAVATQMERGWDSDEFRSTLQQVAAITAKSTDELTALIKLNSENTVKLATAFGAAECAEFIPQDSVEKPAASGADSRRGFDEPAFEPARSSSSLIQILNDISALLAADTPPAFTIVLDLIIEGIYRSLEMDRVLLLIMEPGRKQLKESIALGWPSLHTRPPMQFAAQSVPHTLVSYALDKDDVFWVASSPSSPQSELFTPSITNQIGRHDCLVSGLGSARIPIGLIYADRAHSDLPLTQTTYEGFKQLILQANIALKLCKKPA